MATSSLSISPLTFSSSQSLALPTNFQPIFSIPKIKNTTSHHSPYLQIRALTLDFSGSFFERGSEDDGGSSDGGRAASAAAALEEKEEPQCPPGLRQYETMAVLRPDMTEDERLGLTQKYEELLVAGGGMYVEVFNRGVIPLAYSIKKKNKAGESNTYLDGIYLLFTYFTKPDSIRALETRLKADDDVIRSSTFKIKKRKLN